MSQLAGPGPFAWEQDIWKWIEAVLGKRLGSSSLQEELKDGHVLCNLLNAIQPGICTAPSASSVPFKQMENVAEYLIACGALGVPKNEMFAGTDLIYNR